MALKQQCVSSHGEPWYCISVLGNEIEDGLSWSLPKFNGYFEGIFRYKYIYLKNMKKSIHFNFNLVDSSRNRTGCVREGDEMISDLHISSFFDWGFHTYEWCKKIIIWERDDWRKKMLYKTLAIVLKFERILMSWKVFLSPYTNLSRRYCW